MPHTHLHTYPEHKLSPSPRKKTLFWLLAADAHEARFYTCGRNWMGQKKLVEVKHHLCVKPVDHEMGRHQLGRVFESASPAHHMAEPRTDTPRKERRQFLHEVARMLQDALQRRAFDELVIAAPAKVIGDLRLLLPKEVQERVTMEIIREVVSFSPKELSLYLRECQLA